MAKNSTELALVIDESGSMLQVKNTMLTGLNSFMSEQRTLFEECRVTLVTFSGYPRVLVTSVPLHAFEDLREDTYSPRGSTALYDAIAFTIDMVGTRLAGLPEEERPSQVLVVVLTDGEENYSTKTTLTQVREKIDHQESKYSWKFLFLAGGLDAEKEAARMGRNVPGDAYIAYSPTPQGTAEALATASKTVSHWRSGSKS